MQRMSSIFSSLSFALLLLTAGCSRNYLALDRRLYPERGQGLVTLNFDDGFESVYRNAVPLLKKARIPATFYIITSTYQQNFPDYMKASEIRDLASSGYEIGVHTRTHPHLTSLPREEVLAEIKGARDDLTALGIHARTFAYPYGDYNPRVVDEVKELGFEGARRTEPTFNDDSTNPFLLNRYGVHAGVTFADVKKQIDDALAHGLWLILLFHRIEEDDEYYYNVRPELLQQIVDYLVAKNVRIVTTYQGLKMTGIGR